MDPLTHALFGALAAQAVAHRALPRSAWVIGLVAGAAPDLDLLIRPAGDPLHGLIWHRHFTHALLFVPISAAAVTALCCAIPGLRRRAGAVFLASFAAMALHGLCDALTSYGTLLYWPFSDRRVQWDVLPIIDPLVTLPLLLALAISVIAGRRGARRAAGAWALGGLLAVTAYTFIAARQAGAARSVARALAEARGHHVERVRAMPQPLSILLWRTIYEFEAADPQDESARVRMIQADLVRLPFLRRGLEGALVRVGAQARLLDVEKALQDIDDFDPRIPRAVRAFAWFTDDWMVRSPNLGNTLNDARYAPLPEDFRTLWGLRLPSAVPEERDDSWGFAFDVTVRGESLAALRAALTGSDPTLIPLDEVIATSGGS